jgi:hypothetical protein
MSFGAKNTITYVYYEIPAAVPLKRLRVLIDNFDDVGFNRAVGSVETDFVFHLFAHCSFGQW